MRTTGEPRARRGNRRQLPAGDQPRHEEHRVRLDDDRQNDECSGRDLALRLHRQERTRGDDSKEDVDLTEHELVRVELQQTDDGDDDEPAKGLSPLDRKRDGHPHERDQQRDGAEEPDELGGEERKKPDRDRQHGKCRQVLEDEVPVALAVEGLGRRGSRRRPPVDLEVRHLGPRLVDEHPQRERDEEAPERQPAAGHGACHRWT